MTHTTTSFASVHRGIGLGVLMTILAVSFCLLLFASGGAAYLIPESGGRSAPQILLAGDRLEVIGVHTAMHPASMVKVKAIRYRTHEELISNDVGLPPTLESIPHLAVIGAVNTTYEEPASRHWLWQHFAKQTGEYRVSSILVLSHSIPPQESSRSGPRSTGMLAWSAFQCTPIRA